MFSRHWLGWPDSWRDTVILETKLHSGPTWIGTNTSDTAILEKKGFAGSSIIRNFALRPSSSKHQTMKKAMSRGTSKR
jgi:hypothetical protein